MLVPEVPLAVSLIRAVTRIVYTLPDAKAPRSMLNVLPDTAGAFAGEGSTFTDSSSWKEGRVYSSSVDAAPELPRLPVVMVYSTVQPALDVEEQPYLLTAGSIYNCVPRRSPKFTNDFDPLLTVTDTLLRVVL
jgi:hypothetical protein